jgi:hypothetical protein
VVFTVAGGLVADVGARLSLPGVVPPAASSAAEPSSGASTTRRASVSPLTAQLPEVREWRLCGQTEIMIR